MASPAARFLVELALLLGENKTSAAAPAAPAAPILIKANNQRLENSSPASPKLRNFQSIIAGDQDDDFAEQRARRWLNLQG